MCMDKSSHKCALQSTRKKGTRKWGQAICEQIIMETISLKLKERHQTTELRCTIDSKEENYKQAPKLNI